MKPTPRPLHFWLPFTLLAIGTALNVLAYVREHMNRDMLNARAKVQIRLVNALSEGRCYFTEDEKTEINRLWVAAEYHLVANGK